MGEEVDLLKEIKGLRSELEELKRALAEVKATLSDLTGPYSYYKPPVETEKRVKPGEIVGVERGGETTAPTSIEKSVEKEREEEVSREEVRGEERREIEKPAEARTEAREAREEFLPLLRGVQEAIMEERERVVSTSLDRVVTIIKTLYELRKLYPRSSIEGLVKLLEKMNIVSSRELELLKASMEVVEESLKTSTSPEENIMLLYMILKNLGVRDEKLEEEVTKSMLRTLALMRRRGSRREESSDETRKGDSNKWEYQQQ